MPNTTYAQPIRYVCWVCIEDINAPVMNINEDMIVNGRGMIDDMERGYDFSVFYIKTLPIC